MYLCMWVSEKGSFYPRLSYIICRDTWVINFHKIFTAARECQRVRERECILPFIRVVEREAHFIFSLYVSLSLVCLQLIFSSAFHTLILLAALREFRRVFFFIHLNKRKKKYFFKVFFRCCKAEESSDKNSRSIWVRQPLAILFLTRWLIPIFFATILNVQLCCSVNKNHNFIFFFLPTDVKNQRKLKK